MSATSYETAVLTKAAEGRGNTTHCLAMLRGLTADTRCSRCQANAATGVASGLGGVPVAICRQCAASSGLRAHYERLRKATRESC